MNLNNINELRNAASQVGGTMMQRIEMLKKENTERYIPPTAVFSTVTSVAQVTGDIHSTTERNGSMKITKTEGINVLGDMYVYHDGSTFVVRDMEKVLTEQSLGSLHVSLLKNGSEGELVLRLEDGNDYLLGDSLPVDKEMYEKKLSFGSTNTWTDEFVKLGKIDQTVIDERKKQSKTSLVIILTVIASMVVASIVLNN